MQMSEFLHESEIDKQLLIQDIEFLRQSYTDDPKGYVGIVGQKFPVFCEMPISRSTTTGGLITKSVRKGILNYLRFSKRLHDTAMKVIYEDNLERHLDAVNSAMLGMIRDGEEINITLRTQVGTSNILELCYACIEGMKIAEL